jgi:hypothetical protein
MPRTAELLWYILGIGVIGVGALLVGILAGRLVKKRLRRDDPAEAFTIQDLREMRAREQITAQEYQAMRAALIGRLKAAPGSEPRKPGPFDREAGRPGPDAAADPPPSEDR